MSYDAFLSYAAEDRGLIEEAARQLAGEGVTVWFDRGRLRLSEEASELLVPAGARHRDVIFEAINQAATFVFFDSLDWRRSPYCANEYKHAHNDGKRMIRVDCVGDG